MPEASNLGYVKKPEFLPLEIGQKLEVSSFEILEVTETRKYETALLVTTTGKFSGTSATVLGQLKSKDPKSVGELINHAKKDKTTLTVWVVKNVNPENGNVGYKLSIFKPRG